MSEHPASAVPTPSPEYTRILNVIAHLTGRAAAEKGTARFAADLAALPELTPDQALAALLPTVETELREAAYQEKKAAGSIGVLKFTTALALEMHRNRIHLCDSATLAGELARSSFLRERLFAFATSKGIDALRDTRRAVEAWHAAGRVIVQACPECGAFALVDLPATPDDSDCGLGAISAGQGCNRCEYDSRTHHKPSSRGSDLPFIG